MPSLVATLVVGVGLVAGLVAYESRWRAGGSSLPGWRRWCGRGGALVLLVAVVAPWALGSGGGPLWMETLQLCLALFGFVPLAALGRVGPVLGFGRRPAGDGNSMWGKDGEVPRWRRWAPYVAYGGTLLVWRLPWPVDALAEHHILVLVELATIVAGSWVLWNDVLGEGIEAGGMPPPRRMVLGAMSAWTAWIIAYVLGMSSHSWFGAYAGLHGGLGGVGDQEVAVIVQFLSAAAVCVPVVFLNLFRWLAADEGQPDLVVAWYRRSGPGAGLGTAPHVESDRW